MSDDKPLGLTDVVDGLRAELAEMAKRATTLGTELPPGVLMGRPVRRGDVLVFDVDEVEISLQTTVSRTGGVNGKVDFQVVSVGAEGGRVTGETQVVKLRLRPRIVSKDGQRRTVQVRAVEGAEE